MADLGNSRRISYKATYNQISAQATVPKDEEGKAKTPYRAVEKTAFIHSLQIVPEELPAIREELANVDADDQAKAELSGALDAVERLVADKTATSTLSNARLFARIEPDVLVALATALVRHRRRVAGAIDRSISAILAAHRRSAVATVAAQPEAPEDLGEGQTRSRITGTGVPVRVNLTVNARRSLPAEGEETPEETQSFSAATIIDGSSRADFGVAGDLSHMAGRTTHFASNADALGWAERRQPEMFASLTGLLAPYSSLTSDQLRAVGGTPALLNTIRTRLAPSIDTGLLEGVIAGFQSRMAIEPVGNLHLERIEMYPSGVERGELAHSVPLAPGETVNISHKEWSVSEREFEEIVADYFEGYSEEGVAEKTDISMSNDSQSQHTTALNIGASLSASYSSVTLSTNFGYNATSNDPQSKKDSRNHSMAMTKKASARSKKDHKVTFKVTSITGSEDQMVRVISNPSTTDGMRIDYFQLARKWKVDLLRYGLRMTYDIVIPNPGSGIATLVEDVKALEELIDKPFEFDLPLNAITYNSLAANPLDVSNFDKLAADYDASVTAPPEPRKWVNVHKEIPRLDGDDYDHAHFDSIEFDIDPNYYIYQSIIQWNLITNQGDNRAYVRDLNDQSIDLGVAELTGLSGHLSLDLMFQYVHLYALNITFICRPKIQALLDWRLQVWNEIRQAAQDAYNRNVQTLKERRTKLIQEIADFDALTLRRMEQEEIMKGVLRWLLGPSFYLVPFSISNLFGQDSNDPDPLLSDVLDPNRLSATQWLDVMERGEFIKYLHNAVEWENVLYFTYPYFWDDNTLWDFKKYLYHPDATHRKFLRSGAARVVLTIRPGFETSFTNLVESGSFGTLGPHPYVTIAQEIQDFAKTNYPGFPPANPEQNARPLLYLEQRRVWKEMQFLIQLLDCCKAATGAYPPGVAGNAVPAAALGPYLNGAVVINGANYNGVNDYNTQANAAQLALDPQTPQEALLPTYVNVPVNDIAWAKPYFYQCPGFTGDYDLISYGADGKVGGVDKDADISANSEASLVATWYEYTPINGLDIGITMNKPNVVPPQPSSDIA